MHFKVRLPVPGMQQMGVMNARLADFERQGVHLDGNAGDLDQDFEDAATVGP